MTGGTASLFDAGELPEPERKVFAIAEADESTHIDEIVEQADCHFSLRRRSFRRCSSWRWAAESESCRERIMYG